MMFGNDYRTPAKEAQMNADLDTLEAKLEEEQKKNEALTAGNKELQRQLDLIRLPARREAAKRRRWYAVCLCSGATGSLVIFQILQQFAWTWLPMALALLVIMVVNAGATHE